MCAENPSCKETYSSGPHQHWRLWMKKPVCRSSKDSTVIMTGEYNSVLTCPVGKCSCEDERPWEECSSSHCVLKSHSLSPWDSLGMVLLLKGSNRDPTVWARAQIIFWTTDMIILLRYCEQNRHSQIWNTIAKKHYQKIHTWKAGGSSTQRSDH